MAFPAAPTEGGGDKLHFLTGDANTAEGWIAVVTADTSTGLNPVGFAGIATHAEGDTPTAPGALDNVVNAPVVLIAVDDGTNVRAAQGTTGGVMKVRLEEDGLAGNIDVNVAAALPAGGNNIGDVGVVSIIPGVTATSLGKSEDAVHGTGDTGVMLLAVRDDTPIGLASDGDYIPLTTDSLGRLWTHDDVLDAALSGSELQVDVVGPLPAGTNAIGKLAPNSGIDIGDVDVLTYPGPADSKFATLGQKAMSGSMPVAIASDQGTVPVSVGNNPAVGDNGPAFPGTEFRKANEFTAPVTGSLLFDTTAGKVSHVTDVLITISGTAADVTVGFGPAAATPTGDKVIAKLYGDVRGGMTHQFRGDEFGAASDDIVVTVSGTGTVWVKVLGYEV